MARKPLQSLCPPGNWRLAPVAMALFEATVQLLHKICAQFCRPGTVFPALPWARDLHGPSNSVGLMAATPTRHPKAFNVVPRRPSSRHQLPLRAAGQPQPADHPPAPGTAQPHPDQELFAQSSAGQPFRELAAGPARQLARPLRLPGPYQGIPVLGRPRRRHAGDQPVRLLRRTLCRHIPVRLPRGTARGPLGISAAGADRAAAPAVPRHAVARADEHDRTSSLRSTSSSSNGSRYVTAWSPACRRPRRRCRSGRARAATAPGCWSRSCATSVSPARFVSGYLIQLKPDVKPLDGPAGATADFTDLHAWAEVYVPGAGWIGLDPTSGLLAAKGICRSRRRRITVRAAPITGGRRRGRGRFRLRHAGDPHRREAARHASLLRRCLGGARRARRCGRRRPRSRRTSASPWAASRPSCRSTTTEAAEWNTAAVGPTKRDPRRRADPAAAPTASRRAASCTTARANGIPASRCRAGPSRSTGATTASRCGSDDDLIAREGQDLAPGPSMARSSSARASRRGSASRPISVMPAYEDPVQRMIDEGSVAGQRRPRRIRSSTIRPSARGSMRVFERRPRRPDRLRAAGPALRTRRRAIAGWVSERWELRRERLFLIPGDSPVGFRLPLDSLP